MFGRSQSETSCSGGNVTIGKQRGSLKNLFFLLPIGEDDWNIDKEEKQGKASEDMFTPAFFAGGKDTAAAALLFFLADSGSIYK